MVCSRPISTKPIFIYRAKSRRPRLLLGNAHKSQKYSTLRAGKLVFKCFVCRTFWAIVTIVSLGVGALLAYLLLYRYSVSPTVATLETYSYPTWKLPFPAVTLCNVNKVRKSYVRQMVGKLWDVNNFESVAQPREWTPGPPATHPLNTIRCIRSKSTAVRIIFYEFPRASRRKHTCYHLVGCPADFCENTDFFFFFYHRCVENSDNRIDCC